jgi:hypothetical protein
VSDALTWIDMVGWCATLVFVGSYFCRQASALRRMQMLGAFMWVAYGVLVGAAPVVAANLLVVAAAAWTARRSSAPQRDPTPG